MPASLRAEGLKELIAAARQAQRDAPRATREGLTAAGRPARLAVMAITARRTGNLASHWEVEVRGKTGALVNRTPYAGVAVHSEGRGFDKYGPPPRWGPAGLMAAAPAMEEAISRALAPIVTLGGWGRGVFGGAPRA